MRDEVKAGAFHSGLKPKGFSRGKINWPLEVIAPDRHITGKVIANFARMAKGTDIRIYPLVSGLVEPGALEKLGANKGVKT